MTRETAREAFRDRFDASATVVAVAPGRVNLVGGHVDYNDGVVLPAPIDRTIAVAGRARADDRLRVHSVATDETVSGRVGETPDGWAAYPFGTAVAYYESDESDTADARGSDVDESSTHESAGSGPSSNATRATGAAGATDETGETDGVVGADLLVASDVPMGAGVSSSAAFSVATAGALDALADGGRSRAELADVAWRGETQYAGTDCGIMDQTASACGREGHALRIDCRDRTTEPVPVPDDAGLLVLDTTVRHELSEDGFNDRVAECREAAARLDAVLDRSITSLRDVTPEEVGRHARDVGEPYASRARHVTTELGRVEAAVAALRDGETARLGALMSAAHRSLADDYDVSCPELESAVAAFESQSAVAGARMVGGGWGGSVVAVVDPTETASVARTAAEEQTAATGIEPDVYPVAVGDGLRVHR